MLLQSLHLLRILPIPLLLLTNLTIHTPLLYHTYLLILLHILLQPLIGVAPHARLNIIVAVGWGFRVFTNPKLSLDPLPRFSKEFFLLNQIIMHFYELRE